jgi:flagellar biosynthesis/type III secretory pathway protein FliH
MHNVRKIRLHGPLKGLNLSAHGQQNAATFTAQDLENSRRDGYQRGFEDASAMIESQLVEQREEVLHLQQKTLQAFTDHHDTLTRQMRASLPELTIEIVRRVLCGMKPEAETVMAIVGEVMASLAPGPETVEVCLAARDLKLLESYQAGLRERYPQIEFRVDPDLQTGDCIVTSRFGALDGRLTTKLRSVERMLE